MNKRSHSEISNSTDSYKNFNVKKPNTTTITNQKNSQTVKNETIQIPKSSTSVRPTQPLDITPDEMDKKLMSLQTYLNQGKTHLNYTQFKSLLENLKGNKQPMDTIHNYTNDISAFTKFISEDVYPNVRDSSIKRRCTNILKLINNPVNNSTPDPTPENSDMEN